MIKKSDYQEGLAFLAKDAKDHNGEPLEIMVLMDASGGPWLEVETDPENWYEFDDLVEVELPIPGCCRRSKKCKVRAADLVATEFTPDLDGYVVPMVRWYMALAGRTATWLDEDEG